MTITLTNDMLITALLVLAVLGALVLLILLIKLVPTIKNLSRITSNVAEITESAKDGVDDAMTMVDSMKDACSDVAGLLKGNKSNVAALTNLCNAGAALYKLFKSENKEK